MSRAHHQTRQRQVVLEVIWSTTAHPSAHQIYEAARARLPRISLGTVYRILHALREEGLVQQITDAHDVSRFDGRTDRHAHLICRSCHRIANIDVALPFPDSPPAGFLVIDYRLEFYGYCPDCREPDESRPTGTAV